MPDEIRKMLEELMKSGGLDARMAIGIEAIEKPEAQALIGSTLSAMIRGLVMESPLLTPASQITTAQIVSTEILKMLADNREEHDKTCPKDHSEEVKALRTAQAEVNGAFKKLLSAFAGGVIPEETRGEAGGFRVEDKKLVEDKRMPEIRVDADVSKFDAIMKSAITKLKAKKPYLAEAHALVALVSDYKGDLPVMLGVKAMIDGKKEVEKVKIVSGFIKSVA